MIKKLLIGSLFSVTGITAHAQSCEIPVSEIQVGGVHLLQSVKSFKEKHPKALIKDGLIDMIDVDSDFIDRGVDSIGAIDYSPSKGIITGLSLNYTYGNLADLDTPIYVFKERIIDNSNIPKDGWILSEDKEFYSYKCDDYKIFIRQDHGLGRGTLGAVVWAFSKYSERFSNKF